MAHRHVPDDHLSLQGQDIYSNPQYADLFQRSSQFNAASWDQFNQNRPTVLPQGSDNQSWHQNAVPQQPYASPYGNANPPYQSQSSPFQFSQFNNRSPLSNYGHQSPVLDPALIRQQQQSPYQHLVRNNTPQGQPTITPQALQQNGISIQNGRPVASPYQIPKTTTEMFSQRAPPSMPTPQPVSIPKYEIPKGKVSGGYSVVDQSALANATKSSPLNKLVTLGTEPFHLAVNRTALPSYTARLSVKEVRKAGAGNRKVLDKHTKKSSTKKFLLSKAAGGVKVNPGSPSALKREVSDSETETDTSDDSDDTSDEDDYEDEVSPLPASRPDEPHMAVRYDVIKTAWHPRAPPLHGDKISRSVRDLWEILLTIQKRWRADSKAVLEAEEQKKMGELPVLRSRVTSQRDLLQSALEAVLELAHPEVVYFLGKHHGWLHLCYLFLANRFKAKDFDGPLPSLIYEIFSREAGILTTEALEDTKVIKALISMKKNANDKNKGVIQKVLDAAAAASKKAKSSPAPREDAADSKKANVKRPLDQPVSRTSSEGPVIKKVKAPEAAASPVKKAVASAPGLKNAATVTSGTQKRPGERPAVPAVKARTVVNNKPSTFFSTLNAASKKPAAAAAAAASAPVKANIPQKSVTPAAKDKKPITATKSFSFADTMALIGKPAEEARPTPKPEKQLPPETPTEKAKRLRKESRRHLRVTFKPDASLVDIKFFSHDPDEEEGHEENLVRDAGDIGGEGRMFKKHVEMEDEDDDDDEGMEVEIRPWATISSIDFSVVDSAERQRNYEPYGGGEQKPDCPEKAANEQRENVELMVFYSDRSEIPPSPREPTETSNEQQPAVKEFGPPPQFVIDRSPKPANPVTIPDFSSLESIFRQVGSAVPQSAAAPMIPPAPVAVPAPAPMTAPAPAPAPAVDLSAILSALQQGQAPPAVSIPPPPPVPGFDLSTMLSMMQQSNPSTMTGAQNWPQFPPVFPPQQQMPNAMMQPQTPHSTQQNGNNNKRQRDDGSSERGQGHGKRQRGGRAGHHNTHGNQREDNWVPPHKVVPCKFFAEGKCTKGDDCTFIHARN